MLEEIVRILPPEVAERVNKVVDSEHDQHAGIEQVLARDGARRNPNAWLGFRLVMGLGLG